MGLEVSTEAVKEPVIGKAPGFFDSIRLFGIWPTLYEADPTPVTVDVLEAGLILAFVMLFFCFLVVLPGIRGKERWFVLARVMISLFLGSCVILCNWGQEWEVAEIESEMQYRAYTKEYIKAHVGIKIGLRNVNITLKADDESERKLNETINYNERFWWMPWSQGRIGFGPFAAEINKEYRAAQARGAPYPILWVAEYFTLDGEGIRWGRHYRYAGYYTHIMLWTAFPLWIIANILFFMNPRFGSIALILMGLCMIVGNIIYGAVRNFIPLSIPFEGPEFLEPHFGWCFWLNLIGGILSVILGVLVVGLDAYIPEKVASFFGVDILQDYEEFYPDSGPREKSAGASNGAAAGPSNDGDIETIPAPTSDVMPRFRKKGRTISSMKQKKPMAPPRRPPPSEPVDDDGIQLDIYENVNGDGERKSVQFNQ